jgi:hypothetical protein
MSRIAILCPGPSLRRTWSDELRGSYITTIGVNHACGAFAVDWLCAADLPTVFAKLRRLPDTGVITPRNVHEAVFNGTGSELWNEGNPPWDPTPWRRRMSVAFWEHLDLANRDAPCNYSAVAALAYAVQFRAEVDVYGADMRGTAGVDGIGGENRSDERWERERRDLAAVVARSGARVRRITTYPPENP